MHPKGLRARPVASIGVSAPIPPEDGDTPAEHSGSDHERASAALQAAFDRLAPQGSDAWNFLAAFTHLGDRYGPYQPGASALSALLGESERTGAGASGGRARRLRRPAAKGGDDTSELEAAMAQVVEAFRFLSARVRTLEERLAREDRPTEGAAWLAPAAELGELTPLLAAHVGRAGDGLVVHGDCGNGELLLALAAAGVPAQGVEPRGAVALGALEHGCAVTISELSEDLAGRADGSVHGLVLSGVVDRLPLHGLVVLLAQSWRALALERFDRAGGVSDPGEDLARDPASRDLVAGRPLAEQSWEVLLDRAGFVRPARLDAPGDALGRQVLVAATPS